MSAIVQGLLPVFLLIAIGFAIRRYQWISDSFWAPAEKITYYVFFPALLIASGSRADLGGAQVWPMAFSLFSATFIAAMIALALKPTLDLNDSAFTSFYQGAFRPNTYVGVAVAYLMWGELGVGMMAITILAVVPVANLLAVGAMVRYGEAHEGARTPGRAVVAVARNPLVLGCLVGFGMSALGISLPPVIEPLMDILGRAALPVALLAVGAGLSFAPLKENASVAFKSTAIKLVVLPAVAWLIAAAMGVGGLMFEAMMLYAALSGSATSYVLAREMGGDAPLMAGIITATTLAAMVTMPLWMWLAT